MRMSGMRAGLVALLMAGVSLVGGAAAHAEGASSSAAAQAARNAAAVQVARSAAAVRSPQTSTVKLGDRLAPGQTMDATQYIQSPNGMNGITADNDWGPDVGVYMFSGSGATEFISMTGLAADAPAPTNLLSMQTDGNLVLYTNGKATFNTRTQGNPGAYAVIQNDGNFVVYSAAGKALWASYKFPTYGFAARVGSDGVDGLLQPGWTLVSPNRAYRLSMQTDGNLVLYSSTRATWSAGTQGNPGAWFKIQRDGNLVVYSTAGKALWNSRTARAGDGYYEFDVQNNGNLVQFALGATGQSTPRVIWTSGTAGRS